jgi:CHAT domain-containing protein
VPSLWLVNDFSTALLMQRFHANLYDRGLAKASALREAQRWLRDLTRQEADQILRHKHSELLNRMALKDVVTARQRLTSLTGGPHDWPYANPYWWGAFQCVGAGWPAEA